MTTKCGYSSNATLPIYQRTRSVQTYLLIGIKTLKFRSKIKNARVNRFIG